jgi:outer membrane lipoprotein-sorting protein
MISGTRSLVALLAALALPAQGQDFDLRTLMGRLAEVPSSRTRFVETRELAILTHPLELRGTLSYERPNRLQKHTQSPFDELLSVDGDSLTLVNRAKGEQRVFSLREQPALGVLVESVRATLAGDLATLQKHYRVKLSGSRGGWRLALAPIDSRVRAYVDSITLSGAQARLTRIEVVEGAGDRSVMTILHDGK